MSETHTGQRFNYIFFLIVADFCWDGVLGQSLLHPQRPGCTQRFSGRTASREDIGPGSVQRDLLLRLLLHPAQNPAAHPLDVPRGHHLRQVHHGLRHLVVRCSAVGDVQLRPAAVLWLLQPGSDGDGEKAAAAALP